MSVLSQKTSASPLRAKVDAVAMQLNQGSLNAASGMSLSTESFSGITAGTRLNLDTALSALSNSLESSGFAPETVKELNEGMRCDHYSSAQKQAAGLGVIAGMNPKSHMMLAAESMPMNLPKGTTFVPAAFGGDILNQRIAVESFDESANRECAAYTVVYNLEASRQDAVAEMFFPTVVVAPEQYGYTISLRLISIMDEVRRDPSGDPFEQFGKKNLIRAMVDPSLIRLNQTDVIPVYQDSSKQYFVDQAIVAPSIVKHDGEDVTTSYLKFGARFSLLGISQTDALLQTGLEDSSASLDPKVTLSEVLIQVGTGATADVIALQNLNLSQRALFLPAQQGHYRDMVLNYTTKVVTISSDTLNVSGGALKTLKPVVDNKYFVRLGFTVNGRMNLEDATTEITAASLRVESITDVNGIPVDITTGTGKTVADLFLSVQMLGYKTKARRTNSDRRQRGTLLALDYVSQIYGVPLRGPITVIRPQLSNRENDAGDLAALITASRIATSAAAAYKLFETADYLRSYVKPGVADVADMEILGITRHLVKPYYREIELDLQQVVASLDNGDVMHNIRSSILNVITALVTEAYKKTNYKPAADAQAGGNTKPPRVLMGTDMRIEPFLMLEGDTRTLGGGFDVQIESSTFNLFDNKIVISFGNPDTSRQGTPDPMTFGNCAWRPELTYSLPTYFNGANTQQLTVQPSWDHFVNLPIMIVITLKNLTEVLQALPKLGLKQVP